jgi:hypothetical protein
MAFGQIDPARLEGEALWRWYQRSPAEVEEERQAKAAQVYDSFFGASNASSSAADANDVAPQGIASVDPAIGWNQIGDKRWRATRVPADVRPSSAFVADALPRATPWNCVDCHGRLPPPPSLPIGPVPWSLWPLLRTTLGSRPGEPDPDRDRKQCEMQERRDRGICSQQPNEDSKAVCNESATRRRVHCNETGEIGDPDLFTARRKNGRRWP